LAGSLQRRPIAAARVVFVSRRRAEICGPVAREPTRYRRYGHCAPGHHAFRPADESRRAGLGLAALWCWSGVAYFGRRPELASLFAE